MDVACRGVPTGRLRCAASALAADWGALLRAARRAGGRGGAGDANVAQARRVAQARVAGGTQLRRTSCGHCGHAVGRLDYDRTPLPGGRLPQPPNEEQGAQALLSGAPALGNNRCVMWRAVLRCLLIVVSRPHGRGGSARRQAARDAHGGGGRARSGRGLMESIFPHGQRACKQNALGVAPLVVSCKSGQRKELKRPADRRTWVSSLVARARGAPACSAVLTAWRGLIPVARDELAERAAGACVVQLERHAGAQARPNGLLRLHHAHHGQRICIARASIAMYAT